MTSLPLELGQVRDPSARRALEQLSLQGGGGTGSSGGDGGGVTIAATLPPAGADGDVVFLSGDDSMWVWEGGTWNRVSPGPVGAQGPAGAQGVPGAPGATGAQGATGATGATGSQGPKGDTGAQGTQGVQGIQGPAGAAGSTGSAGAAGAVWRSGTGAPAGGLGIVGDWYLNDANGDIYEKTGASTYTLRDNLTGPQGIQGNPGAGASDATTTTKGIVQLAGDLTGTAASPQIAAGVITDAEVAAANKDGAYNVASMRTLGVGAQQAMTGNLSLSAISNSNASIANITASGQWINNLATCTTDLQAANKLYVDTVAQGLDTKASVYVATDSNITLSGLQTVDGIGLATNDRVLVKNQSAAASNGIYLAGTGAWTRTTDADSWNELVSAFVFVEKGTAAADSGWVCTVDAGGTLGTTAVTWAQFSGAGQITAGTGLAKTGNTLNVGAGAGITVNADDVQVATNGITNAMLADGAVNLASADVTGTLPVSKGGTSGTTSANARMNLGAAGYFTNAAVHGAGTTIVINQSTHGLGASRALLVQVLDEATGNVELPDVSIGAGGNVTVTYGASVAANSKRVTIVG